MNNKLLFKIKMLKLLIITSVLGGLLSVEIKSFIDLEGLNNSLAFSLLKISFILFLILFIDFIMEKFKFNNNNCCNRSKDNKQY